MFVRTTTWPCISNDAISLAKTKAPVITCNPENLNGFHPLGTINGFQIEVSCLHGGVYHIFLKVQKMQWKPLGTAQRDLLGLTQGINPWRIDVVREQWRVYKLMCFQPSYSLFFFLPNFMSVCFCYISAQFAKPTKILPSFADGGYVYT